MKPMMQLKAIMNNYLLNLSSFQDHFLRFGFSQHLGLYNREIGVFLIINAALRCLRSPCHLLILNLSLTNNAKSFLCTGCLACLLISVFLCLHRLYHKVNKHQLRSVCKFQPLDYSHLAINRFLSISLCTKQAVN